MLQEFCKQEVVKIRIGKLENKTCIRNELKHDVKNK